MTRLQSRLRHEIVALHEFFVAWFTGAAAETRAEFDARFTRRFDDRFVLIPPAGKLLSLEQIGASIFNAHGTNPDFAIEIHDVTVRWHAAGHVLATYEEWQRNARASTPPDNGRIATVLFADDGATLRWLHIHETWLPDEVMAAGPRPGHPAGE